MHSDQIGVGIAAAGEGSDFWRPCRSEVPPLCPKSFRAHPTELINYVPEYKG